MTIEQHLKTAIEVCDKLIAILDGQNQRLALMASELRMQIQLEKKRQGGLEWSAESILAREA